MVHHVPLKQIWESGVIKIENKTRIIGYLIPLMTTNRPFP